MKYTCVMALALLGLAATGGCSSDADNDDNGSSGGSSGGPTGLPCNSQPPAGATLAADPPAYSGGTCPTLPRTSGMVQITTTIERQFMLVVPSNFDESERLPLLFIWHWLGGDSSSVMDRGFVQASVDELRFIAVVPDAKEGSTFKWPYSAADTQAAVDEELLFFDDMLSCVSQQFNVNKECVSTGGASAGALWSAQLAGQRGQYIANFISLSGGVGGVIKPFPVPDHKMPALVLWGGPTDSCFGLVDFTSTSQALEDDLTAGGHFLVECIHNCGHGVPPLESTGDNPFLAIWRFALEHPYWLGAGQSPYLESGLPTDMPPWCGVGQASATIREGLCPSPPEC